ncbi:(2Fe-2S) ferredoxin domain-containing protein [Candidatus Dependentiae bacterium]|nr:(2Fe-2S) ferredoxin domain-containing protein [Candidatus Dependentiae bacterium]
MNLTDKKESLYLCVGSACHHKGAYYVLPKLTELLSKNGFGNKIELKGSFCLGPCTDGIVVKFRDNMILKITPENIEQKFLDEIIPLLD